MSHSFADQMQGDLSPVRRSAMLKQINPLPRPEHQFTPEDRNRQLNAGQDSAYVRGHVVGAFVRMPVLAVVRRHTVEKCLEIGANVSGGVLLYEQPGRSMPAKQGQKASLHCMRLKPNQDFARDFNEPGALRRNRKNIHELTHLRAQWARESPRREHWEDFGVVAAPARRRSTQKGAKMRLIILIILIILIVGALPSWPYSAGWR
jgi:Protein of unknown function (DUF3309)